MNFLLGIHVIDKTQKTLHTTFRLCQIRRFAGYLRIVRSATSYDAADQCR